MSEHCFYRWRFQPVFGVWGHLGLDYTLEDPHAEPRRFVLRHVDYGLPGDRSHPDYRHSIALYCAMASENGGDWPPLRTPFGRVYHTSAFVRAPRVVGETLLRQLPRFWGGPGAYRTIGPNSNTGLRLSLRLCERLTGYRFDEPPMWMRFGAWGWDWSGDLPAADGPYPGYFHDDSFRWQTPPSVI